MIVFLVLVLILVLNLFLALVLILTWGLIGSDSDLTVDSLLCSSASLAP